MYLSRGGSNFFTERGIVSINLGNSVRCSNAARGNSRNHIHTVAVWSRKAARVQAEGPLEQHLAKVALLWYHVLSSFEFLVNNLFHVM